MSNPSWICPKFPCVCYLLDREIKKFSTACHVFFFKIYKTFPFMHKIVLCMSSLIFLTSCITHVRLGTGRVNSNWFTVVVSLQWNHVLISLSRSDSRAREKNWRGKKKRGENSPFIYFPRFPCVGNSLPTKSPPSERRDRTPGTDYMFLLTFGIHCFFICYCCRRFGCKVVFRTLQPCWVWRIRQICRISLTIGCSGKVKTLGYS